MEYIEIKEAIRRTGKSDKTIRNWVKANESTTGATQKRNGIVFVSVEFLQQNYPFIDSVNDSEMFQKQKESAQLKITNDAVQTTKRELELAQDRIDNLLEQQRKINPWIPIGLIVIFILGLLYRHELIINMDKQREIELASQQQIFRTQQNALKQQIGYQSQVDAYVIEQLQKDIQRLRTELQDAKNAKDIQVSPMFMHWGEGQ